MQHLAKLTLLLPLFVSAACVPVPNSGEIEDVDLPFHDEAFLAPGEGVVVLGGSDDAIGEDYFAACLREELEGGEPPIRLLPAAEVQDVLFPWLEPNTRPDTETEFAAFLERPGVQETLTALDLRLALLVTGSTSEGETAGVEAVIAGVYGSKQRSSLTAKVFDLKNAAMLGDAGVRSAATGGIAHFMLYGVILWPTTESTACEALGRQLSAAFAGREPPAVWPGPAADRTRSAER